MNKADGDLDRILDRIDRGRDGMPGAAIRRFIPTDMRELLEAAEVDGPDNAIATLLGVRLGQWAKSIGDEQGSAELIETVKRHIFETLSRAELAT